MLPQAPNTGRHIQIGWQLTKSSSARCAVGFWSSIRVWYVEKPRWKGITQITADRSTLFGFADFITAKHMRLLANWIK